MSTVLRSHFHVVLCHSQWTFVSERMDSARKDKIPIEIHLMQQGEERLYEVDKYSVNQESIRSI